MMRSCLRGRSRRAGAAAFLTVAVASVACASTPSMRTLNLMRDPAQWTAVACASCTQAGVEVSVRSSIDATGKAGRHLAARIRNLNPHAVVLVLEIVPDQPRPMDESIILSEKWRLMLSPAGDREHSSTVLLRARHVQGVAVHDVEKF